VTILLDKLNYISNKIIKLKGMGKIYGMLSNSHLSYYALVA
jgi:hypothetical protein